MQTQTYVIRVGLVTFQVWFELIRYHDPLCYCYRLFQQLTDIFGLNVMSKQNKSIKYQNNITMLLSFSLIQILL